MLYFHAQIFIYILFIALSKNQDSEKATTGNVLKACAVSVFSLVLSFLVELPLRMTALDLMKNKWLYIAVVLVIDLCKIVIPCCAIMTMSRLLGNFKMVKLVVIISGIAVIISFAMNTYESLMLFRMQDMMMMMNGEFNFFTTITGGPISYNFGKIHLVVEFIPAVLQAIVCLTQGDKITSDSDKG